VDDECLYAGIQNTDTGLATTVNCPICPVTDGTDGTVPTRMPNVIAALPNIGVSNAANFG